MKILIVIILALGLSGCEDIEKCEQRARAINVVKTVCGSYKGRRKVTTAYHEFAELKVEQAIKRRNIGIKCEDISKLETNIKTLEHALDTCQQTLDGASDSSCDIPRNMPPSSECDCEQLKEGWRQ